MADQKVSDLPALNGADVDAADLLYIVDSSAGSAGSKKITVGQYQLAPVSGGTANGVVYLNGSKVVTTGSGLVFDGTNLGIGTSSPSAKLHVKVGTNQNLLTTSTSSKVTNLAVDDAGSGYVDWQQYANQFLWFTASTQRMALDASGNLGIGTSSPSAKLQVVGGQVLLDNGQFYGIKTSGGANNSVLNLDASNNLLIGAGGATVSAQLWTGGTERARITSGGDLLVGKTASDFTNTGFEVNPAGGIMLTRNAGTNCVQINKKGNTGDLLAFYYNDGAVVGTITNSSTNTAYNTSSDRRLKENIAPAADAGAVIDAIEVVQHDWKVGGHTRFGVIAQDLNAVAPEAVSAGDDGDEIGKTWGVDYSKLVPMLIKEIQSLRARVAALESA